jgi:hypothetical protein
LNTLTFFDLFVKYVLGALEMEVSDDGALEDDGLLEVDGLLELDGILLGDPSL